MFKVKDFTKCNLIEACKSLNFNYNPVMELQNIEYCELLMNTIKDITVEIHQAYSFEAVDSLFSEIQKSVIALPIFLSEKWFSAWLSSMHFQPELVTFKYGNELIGIAFLGKKSFWYGNVFYLNQTGDKHFDQMWIEHNNIICHPNDLSSCQTSLLQKLAEDDHFHRLVVSLTSTEKWEGPKTFIWSLDNHKVCYLDMKLLQNNQHDLGSLLSRNTRSSINRAAKYITKQYGEIKVRVQTDKLSCLNEKIAPMHIAQWQTTSSGSGFSNAHFIRFHEHLCSDDGQSPRTEILEIVAGQHVLGYLYMLLSHKTVYFYLSAINYSDNDNRYKPGMVMHKAAIEHYAALNFEIYDFLAGEARYKGSLSNAHYSLYTVHIANNKWTHRVLYFLNRAVKKLKQMHKYGSN